MHVRPRPIRPHQDDPAPPGRGPLRVLAFVLFALLATVLSEQLVGWPRYFYAGLVA